MPNGDGGNGDDPSQSAQFPARLCPKCRGRDIPCDLCNGTTPETRFVSHFKAAAYFIDHPEIRKTPADFPAVTLDKPSKPDKSDDEEPK
jgi:hypothetical protein